jgi:hypothetical protein
MRAGPCDGVTGSGDCVSTGWSPNWLSPLAWANQVEALVGTDTVCPFCVVERAIDARVPGFSRQKVNRIKAFLAGLHCMSVNGSRTLGHTHLFDFQNEVLDQSRELQPQVGERGY